MAVFQCGENCYIIRDVLTLCLIMVKILSSIPLITIVGTAPNSQCLMCMGLMILLIPPC